MPVELIIIRWIKRESAGLCWFLIIIIFNFSVKFLIFPWSPWVIAGPLLPLLNILGTSLLKVGFTIQFSCVCLVPSAVVVLLQAQIYLRKTFCDSWYRLPPFCELKLKWLRKCKLGHKATKNQSNNENTAYCDHTLSYCGYVALMYLSMQGRSWPVWCPRQTLPLAPSVYCLLS